MNILHKSSGAASRLLAGAGCLFYLIALISSVTNAGYVFGSHLVLLASVVAAFVLAAAASLAVNRYWTIKPFLGVIVPASLALRLIWIFWIDTQPASDFLFMHTAAVSAASGDFSFTGDEYFLSWVYQLGFTMYEALMIKLFGSSLIALKLVNVLLSVGTVVVVYWAAKAAFNEFCGRTAALLYALYIPNIIMCSVLTNQHFSTFFFMLGCLLILRQGWDATYRWIWIGLSFGIAHIMRPIGSVYLIGIVVFALLFQWLTSYKKKGWTLWGKIAGVVAVFYVLQLMVSYSFIYAGITQYPLSNREPYWKFMVGLNAETDGAWSLEDGKYVLQYEIGEERNQAELAVIKERLENKAEVAALLARKLVFMWGTADSSMMWSLGDMNRPELQAWTAKLERAAYAAISMFGCLAMFALLRENDKRQPLLFVIVLLGYAAILLAIEIQTRYRLDMMAAFIILSSYGVYALGERLPKARTRRNL